MKKQRGKENVDRKDEIVNVSLLDSNISNKKRVILREARKAWEIGKKNLVLIFGEMNEKSWRTL